MRTVLIIDDDVDDIFFLTEAIHQIDDTIQCYSALNGDQALKFLLNTNNPTPDFIFLDLNMPKVGGKQCLLRIKSLPDFRNIPIIVCTTSQNKTEVSELIESGAAYFLTKPTNQADLVKEIHPFISS
jgi:CheY-like chemotaxis protein